MCNIDKDNCEAIEERLMERLDRQDVVLELIVNRLITLKGEDKNEERLLDNQDVCEMLKISKRTLQRYRSSEGLPYEMIRHKTFYKPSDVKEFIITQFGKRTKR